MKFYKYCASGNDFVITNADRKEDRSALAKELCNRYEGIGADGFIMILPHEKYDFEWEFYNNDGSRAAMCGNGSRAAAHFAHHINGIKPHMAFLTGAGVIKANVDNNSVEVSLGKIKNIQDAFSECEKNWQLCDTGVPHLVHFCENLDEFDLKLCKQMREKYNANVNFVKVENDNTLRVRTFERGVEDETQACGTGMGACFYLAFLNKKIHNQARVIPKSGEELSFKFENEELFFKGKVRYCFEANYNFS
ncbi:diaminopimelate epimerase [Campylobacter coli]|uniref:diaminopimelate epimerase n=1 Tax=Campylobacter coli TaxID=195 RepID=UPI004033B47C|nr:diaminopimelate epimerase [Campylobacter coli]EIZ8410167.1 diaminopimelate epimerase [Campylobacter coli]